MCSAWDNVALPTLGFPIRASAGQWLFSASPRLIAAVHALRRLLVPRHPPCALTILTVILGEALRLRPVIPVVIGYCAVFKVRGRGATRWVSAGRDPRAPAASRSLKTQQHASRLARARRSRVRPAGPVDMLGRSLEAIAAHKGSLERR